MGFLEANIIPIVDDPFKYSVILLVLFGYIMSAMPPLSLRFQKIFNDWTFRVAAIIIVFLIAQQDALLAFAGGLAFLLTQVKSQTTVRATDGTGSPSRTISNTKRIVATPPAATITVDKTTTDPAKVIQYDGDDGQKYDIFPDHEIGYPLHPDFIHSGPQALGLPLVGHDPGFTGAEF